MNVTKAEAEKIFGKEFVAESELEAKEIRRICWEENGYPGTDPSRDEPPALLTIMVVIKRLTDSWRKYGAS